MFPILLASLPDARSLEEMTSRKDLLRHGFDSNAELQTVTPSIALCFLIGAPMALKTVALT